MVLLMHPYFLNFPQVLFNYVLITARPNLPVGFDPSKWWVLDMSVQYVGESAMRKLGKRIGYIDFEVSSECRGSDSPCRPPNFDTTTPTKRGSLALGAYTPVQKGRTTSS